MELSMTWKHVQLSITVINAGKREIKNFTGCVRSHNFSRDIDLLFYESNESGAPGCANHCAPVRTTHRGPNSRTILANLDAPSN